MIYSFRGVGGKLEQEGGVAPEQYHRQPISVGCYRPITPVSTFRQPDDDGMKR